MQSIIPSIARWGELSTFPQVTEFFWAAQWSIVPVYAVLFFRFLRPNWEALHKFKLERKILLIPPVTFVVIWYLVFMPSGPFDQAAMVTPLDFMLRQAAVSRFWLGVWGGLYGVMAGFALAGFFKSIPMIYRVYVGR
jgi:hypothetical protein